MVRFQPETPQSRAADALADQGIVAWKQNRIEEARGLLEQAARVDEDCLKAHLALSHIRFPGETYLNILARIHKALRPRNYIEIGVATGNSMACALPTTRCIGVDPTPTVAVDLGSHVEVRAITSNEFFATADIRELLDGLPLDLGFIDGQHLFEYAFDDFTHLERHCGPESVLVIHDCLPVNRITAERERRTRFWTGDVWRLLPTLARFRPDLTINVIECVPSGLAVVRGLDPTSDVLTHNREQSLSFGFEQPFESINDYEVLGIHSIPSSWDAVAKIFTSLEDAR